MTAKLTADRRVPTGTVQFYLDGKRLKTVALASDGTVAKVTYPTISKVGTHEIVVKYSGDARLGSAKKTPR